MTIGKDFMMRVTEQLGIGERKPFQIDAPETGEGYMLSPDELWQPTPLKVPVSILGSSLSTGATIGGQSGSLMVEAAGRAVGAVSIGTETLSPAEGRVPGETRPRPILKFQLPSWLLKTKKGMAQRQMSKTEEMPKWVRETPG